MYSTWYFLPSALVCLLFLSGIKCDTYYIVPAQNDPCPVSRCLTVSELFSDTSNITEVNHLTLIFQPGNYTLGTKLVISNISLLEMVSNETATTRIVCKRSAGFKFFQVGTISISGLNFYGCGGSSITLANNFTLLNSTFEGSGSIGTALVLIELATAIIRHCSFVSFTQANSHSVTNLNVKDNGNFVSDILLNITSAHTGGVILCSQSNLVIELSLFHGNEANYGGAIFAELSSTLVIVSSNFHHNKGIGLTSRDGSEGGGGGALFVLNSRIEIENCTFSNNSLVAHPGFHSKGGVLLALMSVISIVDSIFMNNEIAGMGGGGVIYLSHSSLYSLTRTTFIRNSAHFSGVMHLQASNVSITQSNFNHNIAQDRSGVIDATQQSSIEVKNCMFASNSARTMAGVLSVTSSKASLKQSILDDNSVRRIGAVMCVVDQGHVEVNNVTVTNNKAGLSVIFLHSSNADFVNFNTLVNNQGSLLAYNSSVQFRGETTFKNCTSTGTKDLKDISIAFQEGGALSAYSSRVTFHGNTIFIQNSAVYGGAIFAVDSNIVLESSNRYQPISPLSPHDQYPNITINKNTAINTGGGIYLYHSILKVTDGVVYVTENNASKKGGGIHAIISDFRLESSNLAGDVTNLFVLADNQAQLGGGVFMQEYSKLSLDISGVSIRLFENIADYGAAIYVDDDTAFETCSTTTSNITPASECFFRILNPYHIAQDMANDTIVVFENNYAKQGGNDLFGGLLDRCTLHTTPSGVYNTLLTGAIHDHENGDGLSHLWNISNIDSLVSIASHPIQVCFCNQGLIDCTSRTHSVQVKKGEIFNLSIVAVDQVKAPVRASIFSSLYSKDGEITESKRAWTSTSCTDISFSILSSHETETLEMFAAGPCRNAEPSRLIINITFSPCNCAIGFEQLNERSCECVCNSLISEYITDCDATTQSFAKKNSSWISFKNQNNQSTYIISEQCPFRYCQPPSAIRLNLNEDNGADAQCTVGHTGINCASCIAGHGISLAHKRCEPCSEYWYLSLIAVVIGTIIAGLLLVISILAINFTVAIGTINGFIFYANIIDVYDSIFLPLDQSSFPVVLVEWLDLDPGIDGCFIKNIDLYSHIWTRLIFPIYLISIVLVVILISKRSLRFSRLIGRRNPIAALATLILLSLTNFLETAVVSLRPTTLTYVTVNGSQDETVWLADGSVKYFQGKHIPLFLVALLIVLLTATYITLLTFWQWAVYCPNLWILKWTKYQKLDLFIQAYHAPYCNRHRYWTGLLLFVRVLLILISVYTEASKNDSSVPLASIAFILGFLFLLKMTCVRKLYKKWPVDVLELVLLFNLFVFTIFTWFALDNLKLRRILAHLSTTVTLVLLLCVIAYHVYTYLILSSCPKLHEKVIKKFHSRSSTRANNLESDRFHDLIGTIELLPVDKVQQPHSGPKRKTKSTTPTVVTFTTVDGPDPLRKYNRMQQTITERKGDHSETPYVPLTSSPADCEAHI